jgi:hypothetical protein
MAYIILVVILYFIWRHYSKKTLTKASHSEHAEGNFWEVQNPFSVEASLDLTYKDIEGKKTHRVVDVWRCDNQPAGLLVGHCNLRKETRTFRLDRITQAIDTETGEVVADVRAFLWERYQKSPGFAAQKLLEEEYDTLRILLYVGKADGQLRENEKIIIRTTCKAISSASTITDQAIDDIFRQLAVPSVHAFKLAVGRQADKPESARRTLIEAAEKMVATQKTVHPAEKEALEYMNKKLLPT